MTAGRSGGSDPACAHRDDANRLLMAPNNSQILVQKGYGSERVR